MSLTVTVGCVTATEVPSLHSSLGALSDRDTLHVYKLTNLEMPWSKHVPNWQEVFLSHFEFSQIFFRGQVVLKEMAQLGFLNLV